MIDTRRMWILGAPGGAISSHPELGQRAGKLGIVEIDVAAAHDVEHRAAGCGPPAAALVVPAHDRYDPARAALAIALLGPAAVRC
ncbi:MAG: hypothetical protein ACXVUE_22285, partial [Solirubrobacteraceae bacterium]